MATIKMATKEQERQALAQIKEIIAGLGNCSYIGMAMEGMIEDAEENIENDFALSMKDRYEGEKAKVELLSDDLDRTEKELEQARKELELARKTCADESGRRRELWDRLQATEKDALERLNANQKEINELRESNQDQADEIIRLKAKLYDLMTK